LDYAIIKLDQKILDRKPLERATKALENLEQTRIYRVQMDGEKTGHYDGSQGVLQCSVSYSTFLYPGINSPFSPLMTFGDCAIQAGNSGSPILNSEGKIAAMIQGYLSLKEDTELHKEIQASLLDDSFGQVGVGTQIQCMEGIEGLAPSQCNSVPDLNSQTPKEFLAHFSRFNEKELLPGMPVGHRWIEVPQLKERQRRFVTGPQCGDSASFESTEMEFRVGFNRFFQAEWRPETRFGEKVHVFSPNSDRAAEKVIYRSSDGTFLEIEACHLGANK
jgi:hypothetical protein